MATNSNAITAMLAGLRLVNYYPANNGWSAMWSAWNPAEVDTDFARIAALHANAVRLNVFPYTFGYPTPTTAMTSELATAVSLAAAHGLRVELDLFDWWGDYTDVNGSAQWARAILAPYAGDQRIAYVVLKNELPMNDSAAVSWAQQVVPVIRSVAGGLPLTLSITDGASSGGGLSGFQALVSDFPLHTALDFYDYHFYNTGQCQRAFAVFAQLRQIAADAPILIGETGFSTAPANTPLSGLVDVPGALEAYQDHYYRTVEEAARESDLPWAAPWTLSDFAPGAIPSSHTASSPTEYNMGLYRLDGSLKPAAASLQQMYSSGAVDLSINNSFETSYVYGATTLPAEWRLKNPGNGSFDIDTSVAHSGSASFRLSTTSGATPSLFTTPINAGVTPGQSYSAAVWARGANATGSTLLQLSWYDAVGNYLGDVVSSSLPNGNTDWMQLTASGQAPAGAASAQIDLTSSQNSGTVWFDDVSYS